VLEKFKLELKINVENVLIYLKPNYTLVFLGFLKKNLPTKFRQSNGFLNQKKFHTIKPVF
jgi:hypothetical protein